MSYKVIFEPSGIICSDADKNETILHIAQRAGENIAADCGGRGSCGKCRIHVVKGYENLSELTDTEKKILSDKEIGNNIRLACMTKIHGDITAEITNESRIAEQVVLTEGKTRNIPFDPAVKAVTVCMQRPSLEDNRDDLSRLADELIMKNALDCDYQTDHRVIRKLSSVLRKGRWNVTVFILNRKKIIGVFPCADADIYGVAVDIGTTTIAAFLCDLKTGKVLSVSSEMNDQVKFGDDVLARVSYAMLNENGLADLNSTIIEEIDSMITGMCLETGVKAENIADIVMVGNPVMQHIAMNIPPDPIGVSPFVSAVSSSFDISAEDTGLSSVMKSANVHFFPVEAGFVGGDNVAVLIAEEMNDDDECILIVDIGTNSEICLRNREGYYVTSCATGPALEGAQISCGMRAASGAIEHVHISSETFEPDIKIINKGEHSVRPSGICGSGIIDAVSEMARTGIVDKKGRFADAPDIKRIRKGKDGKPEYVLYFAENDSEKDIVVTAKDVRAVQLAKAALYSGAETLIEYSGSKNISRIVLAGAFGSYIDPQSVVNMKMLPADDPSLIDISGNAAGVGARYALLNQKKRLEADRTAREAKFIETAVLPDFQKKFAKAMDLTVSD